jgi:alkylated DNA repair dioxygenase AlkB
VAGTEWEQEYLQFFGRRVAQPRLTAWFGVGMDISTRYLTTRPAAPWTADLREIRDRLSVRYRVAFNSALANFYRDGKDSVSWHADDEATLGQLPIIASVSLGGPRRFLLKDRNGGPSHVFILGQGDLLVMGPGVQAGYVHSVPKTSRVVEPRINLTFRHYPGNRDD